MARRAGVSPAALSTLLAGKYGAREEGLLAKVAGALDYRESGWQVVRTVHNYRVIERVVSDAREEGLWLCISHKAGSAKTATLEDLYNRDRTGCYIYLQAEEWTPRQLMLKLAGKTVGESGLGGGYRTVAELMDLVTGWLNDVRRDRPVVVIDEADKLRPSALRLLIPLYNRTEERVGCVLSGTENLRKELERGVRLQRKGYDELESRLGRSYISLRGASEEEVVAICEANGLKDEAAVGRVWGELEKVKKLTRVRTARGWREEGVWYAEDFRRVKRLVQRELLKAGVKKEGGEL